MSPRLPGSVFIELRALVQGKLSTRKATQAGVWQDPHPDSLTLPPVKSRARKGAVGGRAPSTCSGGERRICIGGRIFRYIVNDDTSAALVIASSHHHSCCCCPMVHVHPQSLLSHFGTYLANIIELMHCTIRTLLALPPVHPHSRVMQSSLRKAYDSPKSSKTCMQVRTG